MTDLGWILVIIILLFIYATRPPASPPVHQGRARVTRVQKKVGANEQSLK